MDKTTRKTSPHAAAHRSASTRSEPLDSGCALARDKLPAARQRQHPRPAFTLIELLMVIGIIILVAGIALPSVGNILALGSDAQAYNLLAGQIAAARALAIRRATYAGVHVQLVDETAKPDLSDVCYVAVMIAERDPNSGSFVFGGAVEAGYEAERVPGSFWFGQLTGSTNFVNNTGQFRNLGDLDDFTTFTVVFSPSGSVVTQVEGDNIQFDPTDSLFSGSESLWDHGEADDESGTTAVTMFNSADFRMAGDRANYLNTHGQLIPVNVHTGELFERK
ncbi:MAG: type II secretion system protein [Planctomycetota bacterium]